MTEIKTFSYKYIMHFAHMNLPTLQFLYVSNCYYYPLSLHCDYVHFLYPLTFTDTKAGYLTWLLRIMLQYTEICKYLRGILRSGEARSIDRSLCSFLMNFHIYISITFGVAHIPISSLYELLPSFYCLLLLLLFS